MVGTIRCKYKDNRSYQTIGGYDLIRPLVNNIKEGKSHAELLVPDDQLGLSGNEYYDLHCRLNKERRYNSYQTYIYTDSDGKICQKPIIYSGDQFRIVKRDPGFLYYLGETIDLIELIPDMGIKDIDKDKDSPDRKQTGRPLECNRHSMLKPHSYGHLIFNQGIKNMD